MSDNQKIKNDQENFCSNCKFWIKPSVNYHAAKDCVASVR